MVFKFPLGKGDFPVHNLRGGNCSYLSFRCRQTLSQLVCHRYHSFVCEHLINMLSIIEAELLRCPDISNALMFGRAKFQAGVLIFPAPHHVFDNEEFKSKKAYIELIWYAHPRQPFLFGTSNCSNVFTIPNRPAIVNANNSSPQHSRIFKEVYT